MTEAQHQDLSTPIRLISRTLGIRPEELPAIVWSFVYFFCIMFAYFTLRSIRETMAVAGGVKNIPWLFTGTFIATLLATPVFGWVASRFPRKIFLPWVYYFFIANILIFFVAFTYALNNDIRFVWIGRAFFVWISVFSLFIVSVFWSFMADIYTKEQSRRLFGVISAGGSAGALLGPIATGVLVVPLGFQNLLPMSAMFLLLAVYCIYRLRNWVKQQSVQTEKTDTRSVESNQAVGGSTLSGVRIVVTTRYFSAIAITLACANFLGGATYMFMAGLVGDAFETMDRQTQVFAFIDFLINAISFVGQLLVVKHSVHRLGIGWTLAILPLVSVAGFALLAINPVFIVLAGLQIVRRAITFGLAKPTSDMLYSVVSQEAKYKAKNFIETALYRTWDLISTWIVRSLGGIGITGVAWICVPIALIWTTLSFWIGREYNRRDQNASAAE